mgnify:CR=1 FL=1
MKTYCRQEISRGDIYYADLRPVIGSEQGGIRPVLILQNNVGNRHSPTVIAAPITSKMGKPRLPTHVCLNRQANGLSCGSVIPKHAHGTVNLDGYTSSGEELLKAATSLYDRIVDKTLLARRLTLCANHLLDESSVPEDLPEQIDLFMDYSAKEKQKKEADTAYARERKLQETMLGIKKRFGKNAILKGLNLEDGATAKERNNQIGGHKA